MPAPVAYLLCFAIGCVCGLRTMMGIAVISAAAYGSWLPLAGTALAFVGYLPSVIVFSLMAVGELIGDKLPIPPRIQVGPLSARIVFGAFCAAALSLAAGISVLFAAVLGGLGALAAAFAGYHARRGIVRGGYAKDLPIALLEDLLAIGGALLVVSRF